MKGDDSISVRKLIDKRDQCPLLIVQMPHISSNILFTIFFGSIPSELPRIERCTLRLNKFIPRACDLFSRMIALGAKKQH